VSWCQHCQHTLPEFEHAAKMIDQASKEGNIKGLELPPKFFILQCDLSPAERKICDRHPGSGLPMLKMFRDKHVLQFTLERWAKKIAEWAVHTSRPVLLEIKTEKEMEKHKDTGNVVFLIKDAAITDAKSPVLQTWLDLAFEHIEDTFFCVVPSDSEVAKLMPPGPSVHAYGNDVEVLPLQGLVTDEGALRRFVKLNRWKVVTTLTAELGVKMMKEQQNIVVQTYASSLALRRTGGDVSFRAKAAEMRQSGKLLFASLDTSKRENSRFLSKMFPAVSVPSIFIYSGNTTLKSELLYWEDPLLDHADFLSLDRLEVLMADDWNRHDDSTESWIKAWRKWIYRLGSGSTAGFVLCVVIPIVVILMLFCCIRELFKPDEDFMQKRSDLKRLLGEREAKKVAQKDTQPGKKENGQEGLTQRRKAESNSENAPQKDAAEDDVASPDGGRKEE